MENESVMKTKTDANLAAAFAGESQARNKYTYFAKVAEKEGYHYIAKLFLETADNEMQHAKEHFKLMKGIGDTKANLRAAMEGEHYENTVMYPEFEKQAKADKNMNAAKLFREISSIEENHEDRYKKLLEMVENGTVWKREQPIEWKCSKCGHIHVGTSPPDLCPCCKHEMQYFEPSDMELL